MDSFPYTVSLALALNGAGAPDPARYEKALTEAECALSDLVNASAPLELLTNVARSDDLAAAQAVADTLSQNTSTIFVLGIGGSSLGGQALLDIVPRNRRAPYDMRKLITMIVDRESTFEIQPTFGRAVITALAPPPHPRCGGAARTTSGDHRCHREHVNG